MDNSKHDFAYPALDQSSTQIRLIHLQPRCKGNQITCNLHVADLNDSDLKYEALSYEWGALTSRKVICLDGGEIAVRDNLWWALYHLQDDETERLLWIDALCIDQSNEKERSHQVSMMGMIYDRAWRVVAWLGREGGEDLAYIVRLLASEELRRMEKEESGLDHPVNPASLMELSQEEQSLMETTRWPTDADFQLGREAWQRICLLSYWGRLWIIQELILAQELVLRCGSTETAWESTSRVHDPKFMRKPFSVASQTASAPVQSSHADIPFRIDQRRSGLFETSSNPFTTSFTTLAGQFFLYRDAKCADARDKIFGLLGISPKCCQESIIVDYGLSNIDLALSVIVHDEEHHQGFRQGLTSSKMRARSFIEYLDCENDANRIVALIEAYDGPLWPPFGTPEEEQDLWRRHDPRVLTRVEGGSLIFQFPR